MQNLQLQLQWGVGGGGGGFKWRNLPPIYIPYRQFNPVSSMHLHQWLLKKRLFSQTILRVHTKLVRRWRTKIPEFSLKYVLCTWGWPYQRGGPQRLHPEFHFNFARFHLRETRRTQYTTLFFMRLLYTWRIRTFLGQIRNRLEWNKGFKFFFIQKTQNTYLYHIYLCFWSQEAKTKDFLS